MAKAKKEELQEDLPVEIGTVSKDSIRAINSIKMALKKKYGDDVFSEKTIAAMPSISTGSALIDADDEDEALEKAMSGDYDYTDIEEWDITETIIQGRVFYGFLNNAEVEQCGQ